MPPGSSFSSFLLPLSSSSRSSTSSRLLLLCLFLLVVVGVVPRLASSQSSFRAPDGKLASLEDSFLLDGSKPPVLLTKCGSRLPLCQWAGKIEAYTDLTPIAPEPNSVSQGTVLVMHGPLDTTEYRVTGHYPMVRFFSYSIYTIPSNQPISSIADYRITPDTGINPFTTTPPSPPPRPPSSSSSSWSSSSGTYRVHITASGKKGYPNEIAAWRESSPSPSPSSSSGLKEHHYHNQQQQEGGGGDEGGGTGDRFQLGNSTSDLFLLALRLYGSDPLVGGDGEVGQRQRSLWGYVDPPVLERRDGPGSPWRPLRVCTLEEEQCNIDLVVSLITYPILKVPIRGIPGVDCPIAPTEGVTPDFLLYGTNQQWYQSLFVGFRNAQLSYLYWCDSSKKFATAEQERHHHLKKKHLHGGGDGRGSFVFRVTGRLPTTPYGLYNDTKISSFRSYDSRYVSLQAVDFAPPLLSLGLIADSHMHRHYGQGWDRRFRVVGAMSEEVAKACPGLGYTPGADMFLSFQRSDGQLSGRVPDSPGFIYRNLVPQVMRLGSSVVNSHSPTDVEYRCSHHSQNSGHGHAGQGSGGGGGDNGRHNGCDDPGFYRAVMGEEYYPTIEVYTCDTSTGIATRLR